MEKQISISRMAQIGT